MRKRIISGCIGAALFMLVLIPFRAASAECYYCSPLYYPLAVVGTVVGGAVTIVTAPFVPFDHRVWIPGHYTYHGYWIPGHWRYYR